MAEPIHISDATFEDEVIKSDIPVIIDFWAIWCGPCKMIAPIMEEIAREYDGKVKVCKMDVDKNPNTAIKFGIRSIPTVMYFKGGKPVDQIIGAYPKKHFVERLEKLL